MGNGAPTFEYNVERNSNTFQKNKTNLKSISTLTGLSFVALLGLYSLSSDQKVPDSSFTKERYQIQADCGQTGLQIWNRRPELLDAFEQNYNSWDQIPSSLLPTAGLNEYTVLRDEGQIRGIEKKILSTKECSLPQEPTQSQISDYDEKICSSLENGPDICVTPRRRLDYCIEGDCHPLNYYLGEFENPSPRGIEENRDRVCDIMSNLDKLVSEKNLETIYQPQIEEIKDNFSCDE